MAKAQIDLGVGGGGSINPTIVTSQYSSSTSVTVTSSLDNSKSYLLVLAQSTAIGYGVDSGTNVYSIQNGTVTEIQKSSQTTTITPTVSGSTLSYTMSASSHTGYTLIQLD